MDKISQGGHKHIEKHNKANTIETKGYWNLVKTKKAWHKTKGYIQILER